MQTRRALRQSVMILLSVIAVVGWVACGSPRASDLVPTASPDEERATGPENGLPVRTVAQEAPLGDQPTEPAYAVMTKPDALSAPASTFPPDALEAGREAAQTPSSIAFIAFAGVKATSGYRITMETLDIENNRLIVTVSEQHPDEDATVEPAMTLPYHVIAVPRDALPDGVTQIAFQDTTGRSLAQQPYPVR